MAKPHCTQQNNIFVKVMGDTDTQTTQYSKGMITIKLSQQDA